MGSKTLYGECEGFCFKYCEFTPLIVISQIAALVSFKETKEMRAAPELIYHPIDFRRDKKCRFFPLKNGQNKPVFDFSNTFVDDE